jgi:hypothetical protein
VMREAGFQGVREAAVTPGELAGWPVVCYEEPCQCAVIGTVPPARTRGEQET